MTNAADWTGRVGDVWAQEWRRTDRSFADLSRHLDAAILSAAPESTFRAFDIGCGAGGTSLALAAARADATIIGADLSEPLVAVATDRLSHAGFVNSGASSTPRDDARSSAHRLSWQPGGDGGSQGTTARIAFFAGDALAVAAAQGPFDLFYSRHGVMFFDDPVAAFSALHRAAAPDARLVFSCFSDWQANAFATVPAEALGLAPTGAGPGPFAFADRAHVASILDAAGWHDAVATPIDFTYRAGAGNRPVDDALDLLQRIGPAAAALRNLPPADRALAVDRLADVIERYRAGSAVDFPAAAWIWSARA